MSQPNRDALLHAYRQRVAQETREVNLRGLPEPVGRDGQRLALHMPLERVYIRLQAIEEAEARRREEEEAQRLAEEARADEPRPAPAGQPGFLSRLLGRAAPAEEARPAARLFPLRIVRTLGEYFYRRGKAYAAAQRPDPVDPEAALQEHDRLVILGAPGAGKSTLLRYLARRAAQDPDAPLPILVPLGEYAAALSLGQRTSLREFALERAAAGDPALHAALAEAVAQGYTLWLLDALDEAREFRTRAARETATLPGQLVLTSRPVGYERPAELTPLPHYEILPLEIEATQDFLRRWFTVLAERRGADVAWAEQRVAWLEDQLEHRPRLRPLARNPLLLTFLALLAGEEPARELPTTRAGLYAAYLQELLLTWETRRQTQGGLTILHLGPLEGEAARQAALQGVHLLGWRLHWVYFAGRGKTLPTREELVAYLRDHLPAAEELPPAERPNLAAAVIAFWEEAGLFVHWYLEGKDFLTFRHLTFQEYAAARVLADLWEGGREARERAWDFLRPRLHHPAWREVLLLLGTLLDDATALVRRVRTARSPYEWELWRDHELAAALVGEGAAVAASETRRLVRAPRRPLARWRQVAFWVGYVALLLALFLWGLRWPWRRWPWWAALGSDGLWLVAWLLGLFSPRIQAGYGLLWRWLALPISSWRVQAMQTMAGRRREAVPALVRALGSKDRIVRWAASEALGRIGTPAVPALTRAMEDANVEVRRAATKTLGHIGASSVPALIRALGDTDKAVRQAAAEALERIGAPSVPALIRALRNADKNVRRVAAEALVSIGSPSVPALTHALGNADKNVRRVAAEALGRIGHTGAMTDLTRVPGDKDKDMRKAASQASVPSGAPAVSGLLRALGDEDRLVRRAAAQALGEIGDAEAVSALISALRDVNEGVREAAAQALGEIGDAEAVPALISALGDEDVSTAAIEALARIGSPAVHPLIRALEDEDVRAAAVETLGRIGRSAKPALIHALENANVRAAAAEALVRIGGVQDVLAFIRALGHKDERVRQAAAQVLGESGDAEAVPALISALKDVNGDVRQSAIQALVRIGTSAVPALISALENKNWQVRQSAAQALGEIGDAGAVPALTRALEDAKEEVREAAAQALEKIGDAAAVPALTRALGDKDAAVRSAAAQALGRIGEPEAVPVLTHALGDADKAVRRVAAQALGRIGDARAVPALTHALGDADEDVRAVAAEALGDLAEGLAEPALARRVARALWWRLTDWKTDIREAAYAALQAVVARWTELAVAALPQQDPLQLWPVPGWRRALRWGLYGLAALLLLAAGSLFLLFVEPIKAAVGERLLPWLQGWPTEQLMALAVALGLAGGGLVALGRWLWGRLRVGESSEA